MLISDMNNNYFDKNARDKTTRRGGRAKPVSNHIQRLTKRAFGKRGFTDGLILSQWNIIIGEYLAELSEPQRISYPGGKQIDGTLHLKVASGSIAVELKHLEPLLIERINGHFGYKAVNRVHLIQGPLDKKTGKISKKDRPVVSKQDSQKISKMLHHVDDNDLHKALTRLATAIMNQKS